MNNITRLFEFPYYQLEKYNLKDALVTKYGDNWVKTSTQEYLDKANAISRGLLRLGVNKNDKIAIISSNNRTEWHITDIGVLQTGAQTVPMYPTISAEDYEYILNHSESQYVFVSDIEVYEKLKSIKANVPLLKEVYSYNDIDGCKSWKEVLELGADNSNQDVVEDRKNNVSTTDLATIIYTSGTTGRPKGVMLSHQNIVSDVLMSAPRVPLRAGDTRALSFLPICHIFERMLVYLYQYYGISIYFAESIEKMSDNLKEVKPHVMTAVPRLLEKVYDKIYAKGADLTGIKKKVAYQRALELTRELFTEGEATLSDLINAEEAAAGVTLTGTVEANSTVWVKINGGAAIQTTATADGTWSITVPKASLPQGDDVAMTVQVSARDWVGNVRDLPMETVHIDTVAPADPVRVGDAGAGNQLYGIATALSADDHSYHTVGATGAAFFGVLPVVVASPRVRPSVAPSGPRPLLKRSRICWRRRWFSPR